MTTRIAATAWASVAVIVLLVVTGGDGGVTVHPLPRLSFAGLPSPNGFPIQHVVVLVMENHPYDNYFGTYCTAMGPFCPANATGIPANSCIPFNPANTSAGCVRPFNYTTANLTMAEKGLPHGYTASTSAWDNGSMDNFYLAEDSGLTPFGHFNGTTLPIYWDIAEEFGMGDHFFSSAFSYSLPNHWYLLAGRSPAIAVTTIPSGPGKLGHPLSATATTYLNQSNHTPSVEDLMMNSTSTTWKYYDYALPAYSKAIAAKGGPGVVGAYDDWNPQGAKTESYTWSLASHFVNRSAFFTDAKAGHLPNASWIIPKFAQSDHPGSNITAGETFVAQVVNAVETSPEWASTALFITWDDYGGFWDQMTPPQLDALGLSFRAPLLVVSPYTPRGFVSHDAGSFESLLHFVEWRFGLGCLTSRDCNASLPLEYFNVNSVARSPVVFTTHPSLASYPIPLGSTPAGVPMGWPPAGASTAGFAYAAYDGENTAAEQALIEPGD